MITTAAQNDHCDSRLYDNVIGIDVASEKLDLHDLRDGSHRQIANTLTDARALAAWIRGSGLRTLVVMEATGGYETRLVDALQDADIDCAVVNPLRIRQFARSCGKLEKNDAIDAAVIAHFGSVVQCH